MASPDTSPSPSPSLPHRSKTAPPPLPPPEEPQPPSPSVPPPATASPQTYEPRPLSSAPSSGHVTPIMAPSALRRTNSNVSSEGSGSKDKKRLRFTPLHEDRGALGLTGTEDYYYPGTPSSMEEGRKGKRGVPKDQTDYLSSVPGTPNIQET